MRAAICLTVLACAAVACGNDDKGPQSSSPPPPADPSACPGTTLSTGEAATPPTAPAVTIADGFRLEAIARINGARSVTALPNGDLLVATSGTGVYIVPHADLDDGFFKATKFVDIDDAPVAGVFFDAATCRVYVGAQHGVYAIAYTDGALTGTAGNPIALLRQQNDQSHPTTGVAVSGDKLYASVGSSCNACTESDPTRATVQAMNLDGSNMRTHVKKFRNPIALTLNSNTGAVWAGGAGQDNLAMGHPYEIFDPVSLHAEGSDYGWPDCEENKVAYTSGANCSNMVVSRVSMPAYSTIIGAAFYPLSPTGPHAFPAQYRGGAFVGMHGSWHEEGGSYVAPPRVAFVRMDGDTPETATNWDDPHAQWTEFVGGLLQGGNTRLARPTGMTVGVNGSLFIAEDQNGLIFRVRPE